MPQPLIQLSGDETALYAYNTQARFVRLPNPCPTCGGVMRGWRGPWLPSTPPPADVCYACERRRQLQEIEQ